MKTGAADRPWLPGSFVTFLAEIGIGALTLLVLGVWLQASQAVAIAVMLFSMALVAATVEYSRTGTPPVHGVDLDRNGNPRGDRVYRRRERDPIYRLVDHDPALPLRPRLRWLLVLVYAIATPAGTLLGLAGHAVPALVGLFAAWAVLHTAAEIAEGKHERDSISSGRG